jgi:hypothetical protein
MHQHPKAMAFTILLLVASALASCTKSSVRIPDKAEGCYIAHYDAAPMKTAGGLAAEIDVPPFQLIDERISPENPWKTIKATDSNRPLPPVRVGWIRINHLLVLLFLFDKKAIYVDLKDSQNDMSGLVWSAGPPNGRTSEFPIRLEREACPSKN